MIVPDVGSYNALVVRGRRIFVAGTFHIVGLRRNGLVALDVRTGTPDRRWAPRVPNCSICIGFGIVDGLAVSATRVYVGGAFTRIGGVKRPGVAALDPRTGAVDRNWRPAAGGRQILELALVGTRLYMGSLHGLLALDARTGASIPLPRGRSPVEVVTLTPSGSRLLVAGRG